MSFEPLSHAQVPPAAPRRRHLGLKIAGGFLVVVGLVLGTGALVDNLGGSPEYRSAPPAAGAVAPDALDPAAFSTAMSAAARGSDPAAFLAFFAPALQVDAGRYFANLRTLGVDGVLVAIQTTDLRELQAESFDGILQIGFHIPGIDGAEVTPMEPLTGMAIEPNRMPSTAYDVTVRRTDTSGVIEAWSPVGAPAPWDVQELVSVQGPGYVLATGVQNEALLGQYNEAAAQATDYTTALFEELLPDLPGSGLDNPGFLLFVEPDDELFSSYFVSERSIGPINEITGYAVPLPSAAGESSGARVVMRPQPDLDVFASVAVHEFVHVMFASGTNSSFLPNGTKDPGAAWIAEGVAEWIQTHFDEQDFTGPTLDAARAAVDQGFFEDRPPTRDELYTQAEFGYPLAASVFEWISETFNVAAAFDAAADNLSRGFDELFASLMYPSDRDF
ncbi:MAG: hypothetical protein H0V10_18710 [Geodermatophilaceae bacterium]|nr:hypothetical protein [Geodermatophilaceae bacterium]